MIKRILFASRRNEVTAAAFPLEWCQAVSIARDAPDNVRPRRVVACTVLAEITPEPRHDGIGLEWFADSDHLNRYEEWRWASRADVLSQIVDLTRSPVIVADEHVMRGGDWLTQRWRDGGPKFKHMAIARRARGLTLPQFFELWRSRAGRVGAVVIPDRARGQAYIQNWPQETQEGGPAWAYDALNEVYFDDMDALQARIAYFQHTLGHGAEDDLVSENWFVAAREEVLLDET
jgi:hypothetical protein